MFIFGGLKSSRDQLVSIIHQNRPYIESQVEYLKFGMIGKMFSSKYFSNAIYIVNINELAVLEECLESTEKPVIMVDTNDHKFINEIRIF